LQKIQGKFFVLVETTNPQSKDMPHRSNTINHAEPINLAMGVSSTAYVLIFVAIAYEK